MKSQPEKILDRAEERLRDLPQSNGEQTLHLLRGFLRMESHRLRMLHRYGLGGLDVALARAQVVDALITHLYRLALERYQSKQPSRSLDTSRIAIGAVGGYGRSELCPHSDVDLLILYERSATDIAKFLAHEMIYLLWDVGLKVGHSWRTPEECVEMARDDSSAENSLIDARHLIGGSRVWESLQALLHKHWRRNPRKFVERKCAEVEERYGRLGETVFLQEPNVKESSGGLRDYHTMVWLARGCWMAGDPGDLVRAGIFSEADWQRVRRAYDSVMRVRNELHYLTDRRADQLTMALQPEVAANLKFRAQENLLAPEVFMRDFFLHAENLHRAMRQVIAASLHEKGKKSRPLTVDSPLPLARVDDELRLSPSGDPAARQFPATPLQMMQAVNLAQRLRLRLGEDVKGAIRKSLATLRREWQRSPEMAREFLEMIRRPGQAGHALRSMHSCGVLSKYLPEFAHVTRLMQADYYHRYTTDEHTLRAVELLDSIFNDPPASLERYRDLTYHISDLAPLYLGLLLHDVGKGLGGNHSEKGAQRALAICERIGLPPRQTAQVELLVRQHLLLSHLSQRRDLSDRRVAQTAAPVVGDIETLSMLTLLTYADTAAVGPDIWTEWKNVLLWELYTKVHDELLGLETASAQEEARLFEIRVGVREILESLARQDPEGKLTPELARQWMDEHLSLLPPRYALGHRPELIANQILLAKRAATTGPAVDLIPIPQEGYTLLLLCCPDTPGLFARVAGTLASLEVNIMGARLDTRKDGMAVDVLWISTPAGNVIADPPRLRRIRNTVEGVLKTSISFDDLVRRIHSRPLAPAMKHPQITMNNDISDTCTVLEILATDRLGFAYSVAQCLTRLGLSIQFAKLATEKTMVFDVFYLTDSAGQKLPESSWDDIIAAVETVVKVDPQITQILQKE
ncbi:MAG: [protein-PII] uridylyltransferase [Acidobacteria bacterium]|nr:[protein-PII] uridylyltransferase [Acidobacteriota bacterium]